MSLPHGSSLNLNSLQVIGLVIENLASAPGSPVEGRLYDDTALHQARIWLNGAWVNLGGGGLASAYTTITDGTTPASASGSDTFRLRSADNKLSIVTANNDATFGDNALFTVNPANITLNSIGAPTAAISMATFQINNLGAPTAATDAATKAYVDATSTGLDVKASVRAASAGANVTVTYTATAGASGRGQITAAPNALDGVTLAANDRILLKDQSAPAQNGIWVVTTLGTGANGVWDRASDFDQDAEVTAGAFTFVAEGTVNADTGWVLSTNDPIIIGGASGTSLAFTQFSAAGQVTFANVGAAGVGTYDSRTGLVANMRKINTASTKISVVLNGQEIDIDAVEANFTLTNIGGTLSIAKGGTNAGTAATARDSTHLGTATAPTAATNVTVTANGIATLVKATITHNGAQTAFTITHNLGNTTPNITVFDASGNVYYVDTQATDANTVVLTWAVAQPNTTVFRVQISG